LFAFTLARNEPDDAEAMIRPRPGSSVSLAH
jgi:hypothetical protein